MTMMKTFKMRMGMGIMKKMKKYKKTTRETQNQHRTKTPANNFSEIPPATSIENFKQQIYNIKYLSLIDSSYALQNNLALLDKIIDFVERSTPLLDQRYTEDVWHIKAELYHLKSMIINMNIYSPNDVRKKINEIIDYTNEHL